jgi:hypothetical protein
MLPALPWLLLLLLNSLGCMRAVQINEGLLNGEFQFAPPPTWTLQRNYRFLGSHTVLLVSPDNRAALSVQLLPAETRATEIPLDLLGEVLLGNLGRKVGVETSIELKHEIVIADRRAFAFTGYRRQGPNETDFTAIISRTQTQTLLIVLTTQRHQVGQYAGVMEALLETLELTAQPAPPTRLDTW